MASGDTKTESYLRVAAEGARADLPSDTCCNTKTQNLILGVANRIMDVEDEVEEMKNNPDVVDIVGTYADLQNYDTSTLTDKDVIRVLVDEQHDGQSTYYRWDEQSSTWTYIGAVGDYYTKGQVDDLLDDKQDVLTAGANITISADNEISATDTTYTAGTNIQISAQNEISATDTTYSNFVGTNGTSAGESGLVPAPATTDTGKFLKSDGTWGTAGPTVVQTTGTSTTDVMSQNAVTSMVFRDPSSSRQVQIGAGSESSGNDGVAIGRNSKVNQSDAIAIGSSSVVTGLYSTAIGTHTTTNNRAHSVAMGSYAVNTRSGEVNIGTGVNAYGYDSTPYRVLGGVHDPVDAHDAATKGYVDTLVGNIESALHAINNGGNA